MKAAQQPVRKVYEHVRLKCQELRDANYLPKYGQQYVQYGQLGYLRRLHKDGNLTPADYCLLAHLPHILGPAVFGRVEPSEKGWRWTFAPAGVDVQGDDFQSQDLCLQELREIQKGLYPAWHEKEKRAAHLQQLLRVCSISLATLNVDGLGAYGASPAERMQEILTEILAASPDVVLLQGVVAEMYAVMRQRLPCLLYTSPSPRD